MSVSLAISKDLIANYISVKYINRVIDLKELFLSELSATHSIVGFPVSNLNSLRKLAEAINSDANFLK